jgi:ribosomal protein S18 acetylase RimI-like enzyme
LRAVADCRVAPKRSLLLSFAASTSPTINRSESVKMNQIIIRNVKKNDISALAEVVVLAWQIAYRNILPDRLLDNLSIAKAKERWANMLKLDHIFTLVAEYNSRAIGFVRFGASRDSDDDPRLVGEVYAIYVHPDFWRMGAGGALLRGAIDELRRRGFAELTLWTLQENARARAFYEEQDLNPDRATKEVKRGGKTTIEVRYRRTLQTRSIS